MDVKVLEDIMNADPDVPENACTFNHKTSCMPTEWPIVTRPPQRPMPPAHSADVCTAARSPWPSGQR